MQNPFDKVSFVEKLMFTKHLSIMIRSGVPLYEAIETLGNYSKTKSFKKILTTVLQDIENGKSLYNALRKHNHVFDNFYISLIKVSEESGTLEETLDFLAKQLSKDYALKKKVQGAMFYPSLIFFAGLGIGGFISLYILPQLVDFFENLEIELPFTTRVLLFFATLMQEHGIVMMAGVVIFFISFKALISTKLFKPYWHLFIIRVPILGKVISYGQLTRITRNLATLLKSGVPLASALQTTSDSLDIIVYKKHLLVVRDDLIKGKNVSDSLSDNNFTEFPPIVTKMIRIGERTGNLEEVLNYLSDFYEEEIDNITKNLTTILEPILLVAIGLMVGFIALAIIGPIYQLTGSIG